LLMFEEKCVTLHALKNIIMYNPRPIPVLTGQSAERFEQLRMEAEQADAPRYNLKAAKSVFTAIMARSKAKAE